MLEEPTIFGNLKKTTKHLQLQIQSPHETIFKNELLHL
jgi:hypothetical protein